MFFHTKENYTATCVGESRIGFPKAFGQLILLTFLHFKIQTFSCMEEALDLFGCYLFHRASEIRDWSADVVSASSAMRSARISELSRSGV